MRFPSNPGATVRSQGPLATAKAQLFCPQKEIARWQDKSHLVFLDFLLFSNKESTHAELLRETALTRTLPDATRSL